MGNFDTYIHDVNIDFIYSSSFRRLNSREADLGNVSAPDSESGDRENFDLQLVFE